jgi:hypothetical protein
MPFGSVNFEAGVDDKGERYVWLPRAVIDRLRPLRGPGESFSDVILALTKAGLAGLGGIGLAVGRRCCRSVIRITPSYGKLWFSARVR